MFRDVVTSSGPARQHAEFDLGAVEVEQPPEHPGPERRGGRGRRRGRVQRPRRLELGRDGILDSGLGLTIHRVRVPQLMPPHTRCGLDHC